MIDNPLELPAPEDPIERIHAFARDLAYGVSVGLWDTKFVTQYEANKIRWKAARSQPAHVDPFRNYATKKWNDDPPWPNSLVSFGYLSETDARSSGASYLLLSDAFHLLNAPVSPPTIFISYRRDVSSALSLLIEARLKLVDRNIGVFIDKALEPGDEWHGRLEASIRQSQYFICLLALETLGSGFVRKEVRWALDEKQKRSDFVIIPMCHDEFHFGAELHDDLQPHRDEIVPLLDQLGENNAILVKQESAEEYELALIKLLNRLGYSTI